MMPENFTRTVVGEIITETLQQHLGSFDPADSYEEHLSGDESNQSKLGTTEYLVVLRLKKCGWIEISPDENNELLVSFTDAALTLLPKLNELSRPNKVSLGGYTRNIVSNLKSLKTTKHPYTDAFIHAFNHTEEFMKIMDRMRREIKRDIQRILLCEDYITMNEMLAEYLENNLNGDYYRVQFEEGLDAEARREISDCILDTKADEVLMDKLIEGAIDYHGMTRDEAETHICTRLDMMYEHLYRRYDERYNRILREQRKYINNASAKLNAYAIDRKNVRGLIKELLLELNKETAPDNWDDRTGILWIDTLQRKLNIPGAAFLDETSLYRPRKISAIDLDDIELIPLAEPSEDVFKKSVRSSQPLYTPKKVEKMIRMYIGDKDSISSETLPLQTNRDLADLIAMAIMTKGETSPFEVEFMPSYIEKNGFEIPDFNIRKKPQKKGRD